MQNFASFSLAPATVKSYQTAFETFKSFCEKFDVWRQGSIDPADETLLCYYATHLAKTVRHDTIKNYLAALKHQHLLRNLDLPLHKFHLLHYLL